MRIAHYKQLVTVARFEFVSVEIISVFVVIVVGSQIVRREFKFYGMLLSLCENGSFGKIQQHAFSLFYSPFRVGRVSVKLYDVATRFTARVFYCYADSVLLILFKLGNSVPVYCPVEFRVRQPVTEGILYYAVVTFSVIVGHVIEISVRVGSFVPLVPVVNTFLICYVAIVLYGVYIYGVVRLEVVRVNIARPARRIDFTRNYFGNGSHTRLPGNAYMQASFNAGIFFQKSEFDIVADV